MNSFLNFLHYKQLFNSDEFLDYRYYYRDSVWSLVILFQSRKAVDTNFDSLRSEEALRKKFLNLPWPIRLRRNVTNCITETVRTTDYCGNKNELNSVVQIFDFWICPKSWNPFWLKIYEARCKDNIFVSLFSFESTFTV